MKIQRPNQKTKVGEGYIKKWSKRKGPGVHDSALVNIRSGPIQIIWVKLISAKGQIQLNLS